MRNIAYCFGVADFNRTGASSTTNSRRYQRRTELPQAVGWLRPSLVPLGLTWAEFQNIRGDSDDTSTDLRQIGAAVAQVVAASTNFWVKSMKRVDQFLGQCQANLGRCQANLWAGFEQMCPMFTQVCTYVFKFGRCGLIRGGLAFVGEVSAKFDEDSTQARKDERTGRSIAQHSMVQS